METLVMLAMSVFFAPQQTVTLQPEYVLSRDPQTMNIIQKENPWYVGPKGPKPVINIVPGIIEPEFLPDGSENPRYAGPKKPPLVANENIGYVDEKGYHPPTPMKKDEIAR
jgi:hypothetical protein